MFGVLQRLVEAVYLRTPVTLIVSSISEMKLMPWEKLSTITLESPRNMTVLGP